MLHPSTSTYLYSLHDLKCYEEECKRPSSIFPHSHLLEDDILDQVLKLDRPNYIRYDVK